MHFVFIHANYSCTYQPVLLRMPHLLQRTACLWDLQITQAISRSFFLKAADFFCSDQLRIPFSLLSACLRNPIVLAKIKFSACYYITNQYTNPIYSQPITQQYITEKQY